MPNPTLPVTEVSALQAPDGLSYIEARSTLRFLESGDLLAFKSYLGIAGEGGGPILISDLSDATTFGKSLLALADAPALNTALAFGKTLHVATSGSAYTTLAAAKAAAVAGDLIIVHPGSYTVTESILKDGVNWHFAPGATVTMDLSANATVVGPLGDATGIASVITGSGIFIGDATGRTGVKEVTTFDCTGAAALTNGDVLTIYGADNQRYDFWVNFNGIGTPPGLGGYESDLDLVTGFTVADFIAEFTYKLGSSGAGWTVTDDGTTITVTDGHFRARTNAIDGTGGKVIVSVVTPGADMALVATLSTVAGSELVIHAARVEMIYPGARPIDGAAGWGLYPTAVYAPDGSLKLSANKVAGTGMTTNGIWWKNGPCYINVPEVIGGNYAVWSKADSTPTGDFYLNIDHAEATATVGSGYVGAPFYSDGTNSAAAIWADIKVLKAAASHSYSLYVSGAERVYLASQKVFGIVAIFGTGDNYIQIDKVAATANNQRLVTFECSGRSVVDIGLIDSVTFTGLQLAQISNGNSGATDLTIKSAVGLSSVASGLVVQAGSNVRIKNSRIDVSAGTNKSAVSVTGGAPVFLGCVFAKSGTGYDINVTGGSASVSNGYGSGTGGNLVTNGTVTYLEESALPAGSVTNAMLAGSIDLTSKVAGALPVANGGTGRTGSARFHASIAGYQNVSAGTTLVDFDTESIDIGGFYNTTTKQWTPPAGPVVIGCNITADQSDWFIMLYKNGAQLYGGQANPGGTSATDSVWMDECDGNDVYEIRVAQNNASRIIYGASVNASNWWGYSLF